MFRKLITQKTNTYLLSRRGLLYVLLFLFAFNTVIYIFTSFTGYPKVQRRKDAVGLSHEKAQKFVYFYYYKGLFPLLTLNDTVEYSKAGAEQQILNYPDSLLMEYEHWARLGENARIFTYLPSAFVRGSPKDPSVKLFNALFFLISLSIAYWGFWRARKPLFGLIIVLLTNFSPFFLFEIFTNENIFGLMGASFIFLMGINSKWLLNKKINWIDVILMPILTGLIIGFSAQIRNEVVVVIVAAFLVYLLAFRKNIFLKLISIVLLFSSYYLLSNQIQKYFDAKFVETKTFVEKVGGNAYNGATIPGHKFWHPVFCGLGDWDYKYGYEWDDKVAYRYAVPVLKDKYGIDLPYDDEFHTGLYYDSNKYYYKKFDEIEEYEQVVKDKVLSDIKSDPFWLVYIMIMRIIMVLTVTQPLPLLGWFALYVLYVVWKKKLWNYLIILIVSMPLSATSIIIYSARGTTYNSMFPLIALAIFLYLQPEFEPYLSKLPIVKRFYKKP